MSKDKVAIIIDKPEFCSDCPAEHIELINEHSWQLKCYATKEHKVLPDIFQPPVPDWCPAKEIPDKPKIYEQDETIMIAFKAGMQLVIDSLTSTQPKMKLSELTDKVTDKAKDKGGN